ncbi:MAG TPA: acyltransferase [Steroidobacteraceae bacterium]|nr:acyltransferase [Steroidobacteraceae bacterium]
MTTMMHASFEPTEPARSWLRLDGVDLLRGIAIALVLMNHVNMRLLIAGIPYAQALPRQLLSGLVWNGQCGVQIFFAVSGFLITATSLRRWATPCSIRPREFYLLRFARIAPLLILLLIVLGLLHCTGSKWFFVPEKAGGLGRALLAALTFRVNVLESQRGYLPGNWDVLWSLSVEETFYLLFPLCLLWFGRSRWLILLLVALIVAGPLARTVFAGRNEVWREYSYLGGMDAIALGCLTALLAPRLRFSRRALITMQTIGVALMIFILCFSIAVKRIGLASLGVDMTILALGTCMVMAAVAQSPGTGPLVARPLLLLGRRSYEIYLTHMFIVIGGFVLFTKLGKPPAGVPILFVAVILVAAALGELVARFYSEPMNRYLRRRWGEGPDRLGAVVETV